MSDLIKVLVADDEEDLRQIMEKKISQTGYDVVSASDGQDAWEKIVKHDPDIIVLDLMMPRLDGYEVLKKLRETPPSEKWQPVIIVSAKGELDDIHKGLDMDADHYLTKPCSLEDIIKGIRLMISLIPQRRVATETKG